ncbi:MAG: hypothetical protein F4236_09225 [Acidimicrobiia bacterium]|nr:hypothetical protein [Acidimicrobiia bacterium]
MGDILMAADSAQSLAGEADAAAEFDGGAKVPREFWHMFWNGDPSALRLPRDAEHVAVRLICSHKTTLPIMAWALCNLPTEALLVAATGRNPPTEAARATILNMVAARREGLIPNPG